MIFRRSQIEAFKRLAIDDFVTHATAYLDQVLKGNTALWGKSPTVATIHYGIERAGSYGIIGQRDVCLYLRLMFTMLGSDFDRDPLYSWASDILSDDYYPPNDRMLRLTYRADTLLDAIERDAPQYVERVLATTHNNLFSELPEAVERSLLEETVLNEIRRWFPVKLNCVSETNARRLITCGIADAPRHGLQRGPDIAVFVQFMFIHGSRFYADPKYPRIRTVFTDARSSGAQKIEAIFTENRDYLRRKLQLSRAGED